MAVRQKPPGELGRQVSDASKKYGEKIAPPSVPKEGVFALSLVQIKAIFPERYRMYLESVRQRDLDESKIAGSELDRMKYVLSTLNNLDEYNREHEERIVHGEKTPLRPHQATLFQDISSSIEQGNVWGYFVLPSGTGKTNCYIELIKACKAKKTLLIVPSRPLIRQTKERFKKFAPDTEVGVVFSEEKTFGKNVTVITGDSYMIQVQKGTINPNEYDLILLDEAHEYLGAKTLPFFRETLPKNKIVRGGTATDKYSQEKKVANLLINEDHRGTIRESIAVGSIAPLQVIKLKTNCDITKVSIEPDGNLKEEELQPLIKQAEVPEGMIETYKKLLYGRKAMAFFSRIERAKDFAALCNGMGVPAAAFHSDLKPDEQKEVLRKYAAKEILVLASVGMLSRGFDDHETEIAMIIDPNMSIVDEAQECMRPGRKHPWEFEELADQYPDKRYGPPKVNIVLKAEYQTKDPRKIPADIVSIAQGSCIYPESSPQSVKDQFIYPPSKNQTTYIIHGMVVVVDPEEVLMMTKESEKRKYERAPAGWLPVRLICADERFSDLSPVIVRGSVRKLCLDNPDWEQWYRNEKDELERHYSPELIDWLEKKEFPAVPKGWESKQDIAQRYRITGMTVDRYHQKLRRDLSTTEFEKQMKLKRGNKLFLPPEVDESLKRDYNPVPETAKSSKEIAKASGGVVPVWKIEEFAETFREKHPDWFYQQTWCTPSHRTQNSRREVMHDKHWAVRGEYYTEELVTLIEGRFVGSEKIFSGPPRAGWEAHNALENELGPPPQSVLDFVRAEPRVSQLRFFNDSIDRYYSAKVAEMWEKHTRALTKKYSRELEKRYQKAPLYMVSLAFIVQETQRTLFEVKRRLGDPEKVYPLFLDENGIPNEHVNYEMLSHVQNFERLYRNKDQRADRDEQFDENLLIELYGPMPDALKKTAHKDQNGHRWYSSHVAKAYKEHSDKAKTVRESVTLQEWEEMQKRPEGAISVYELSQEIGVYYLEYPRDYTQEEREIVKIYLDKDGIPNQHFSAKVADAIRHRFLVRDITPWGLEADDTQLPQTQIFPIPELSAERLAELAKEAPPEGSMTELELMEATRLGKASLGKFLNLTKAFAENCGKHLTPEGKYELYYYKKICDAIFKEFPPIPLSWPNFQTIAYQYRWGPDLAEFTVRYNMQHPGSIVMRERQAYHSDNLVSAIRENFDDVPKDALDLYLVMAFLHMNEEDFIAKSEPILARDPQYTFFQKRVDKKHLYITRKGMDALVSALTPDKITQWNIAKRGKPDSAYKVLQIDALLGDQLEKTKSEDAEFWQRMEQAVTKERVESPQETPSIILQRFQKESEEFLKRLQESSAQRKEMRDARKTKPQRARSAEPVAQEKESYEPIPVGWQIEAQLKEYLGPMDEKTKKYIESSLNARKEFYDEHSQSMMPCIGPVAALMWKESVRARYADEKLYKKAPEGQVSLRELAQKLEISSLKPDDLTNDERELAWHYLDKEGIPTLHVTKYIASDIEKRMAK